MQTRIVKQQLTSLVGLSIVALALGSPRRTADGASAFSSIVPKTWDDAEISVVELPLAEPSATPKHITADYYYRIPVRPIYKSYPVYALGKEPDGYIEWLNQQEPQTVFEPSQLKTPEDWTRAGE